MNSKKNHKLIILIVVFLVILVLLIGVAVLYFTTDFLKSNKQLFFNYISQIGSNEEGFTDPDLLDYLEAKESIPYKDKGEISFDVMDFTEQGKYENFVNDMSITFTGEVNNANQSELQNVSINYSNDVTLPLLYKRVLWTKGIQADYIGSKFVATNVDADNSLIGEIEELGIMRQMHDMTFTDEDLQYLKDMYILVLNIQSQEDEYSKIQEVDNNSYKITLKGQDLKNVLSNLLNNLQSDTVLLDKLNLYIKTQKDGKEITTKDIEDILQKIEDDTELNEKSLEIEVYQNNGKVNKLTLVSDICQIVIEKVSENNKLQYNVDVNLNINNKTLEVILNLEYLGLQSGDTVTENYNLTIQNNDVTYKYLYTNEVQFVESVIIEKFLEDNSLVLEDMEEEPRKNLVNAIRERMQTVNTQQMSELGLEANENPLQYLVPQLGIFTSEKAEEGSTVDEKDVEEFNTRFENYASTNLQGVTVKGLLTTIALNNGLEESEGEEQDEDSEDNEENPYLIKEIHFDGTEYEVNRQNIASIKSSVEADSYYRVEFEKDENTGIIYRAVINKK